MEDILAHFLLQWFAGPNWFSGHVANAWEEDGKLHIQTSLTEVNGFGFVPDGNGNAPKLEEVPVSLNEWTIDPHSEELVLPKPGRSSPRPTNFPHR